MNSSSGKKKINIGERHFDKVIEIRNLWEKRNITSDTEIDKKNLKEF